MAKKQKKQESAPDGPGPWMTSYADMVTVLFALFVMLYAMSDIDEDRFAELAQAAAINAPSPSIFDFASDGINDLVGNGIMDLPFFDMSIFHYTPSDVGGPHEANQMEVVADVLQTYFGEANLADFVQVEFDGERGMILIQAHGDMYFATGRADIREETFPILDTIGSAISTLDNIIVSVEGHTDDVPIGTAQFPDNWVLSSARATNILRYFVYTLEIIEPDRIQAVGHGEYRPIASNSTAEGRQANRRVEILIFEANGASEAYEIYEINND